MSIVLLLYYRYILRIERNVHSQYLFFVPFRNF